MFAWPNRDRIAAGVCSIAVVTIMGCGLLYGLTVSLHIYADNPLTVLDIENPRPQSSIAPPPKRRATARAIKKLASEANRRGSPSAILAPQILPLISLPIAPSPAPNLRSTADDGVSARFGLGQGPAGSGSGLGEGENDDGGDIPPRRIKGKLNFADMPSALRIAGGERVAAVRYQVDIDGRVDMCVVTVSTGSPEFDETICRLIEKRFRFEPSKDQHGQAVSSIVEEEHRWGVVSIDAPTDNGAR